MLESIRRRKELNRLSTPTVAPLEIAGAPPQSTPRADSPVVDDLTADLMRSIASAIEQWGHRHNLQNLPQDIVFEQALMALNEMYRHTKRSQRKE